MVIEPFAVSNSFVRKLFELSSSRAPIVRSLFIERCLPLNFKISSIFSSI